MSDNDTVQRLAVGSPSDKQRTKRRVEPRKLDLAFASSGFMGESHRRHCATGAARRPLAARTQPECQLTRLALCAPDD